MMGIICDLVIANEGAAQAIVTAENRFDAFRVYPTKLLDPVTLDGLFALLDPESPDLGVWWEVPLAERDEQVVCQLPPALVARLATLTPGQRHDLAWRWWQQSEELRWLTSTPASRLTGSPRISSAWWTKSAPSCERRSTRASGCICLCRHDPRKRLIERP